MIVLIIGHFLTSVKFRGNIKIPQKRANSVAWLEILRPAEKCGPWSSRIQIKQCTETFLNGQVGKRNFQSIWLDSYYTPGQKISCWLAGQSYTLSNQ